jgi:AcrR family transcriptional regulator
VNKGERTKQKILKDAMKFASVYGLSKVTIGEISKLTNMSRTGVISHFKDKEDMQIAIIQYSGYQYIENVIYKSKHENSLTRLRNYYKCWRAWVDKLEEEHSGSCPLIKATFDYQDREENSVSVYIKKQQRELIAYVAKLVQRCIDDGYFKSDLNANSFAVQSYSYYLGYNVTKNLYGKEVADQHARESIRSLIDRSLNDKSE